MSAALEPITQGRVVARLEAGGFILTETAYEPATRLPLHAHRHACIVFVLQGSFREVVGRRVETCRPSSLVFKPAREPHADEFGPTGARCLLVEVTAPRLASIEPFSRAFREPRVLRGGRAAALARRAHAELRAPRPTSALAVEGVILELLADEAPDDPAVPAWLARVRDALHARFTQDLGLEALAREAGVHPAHLARSFRRHFRTTIGEYVRRMRVEAAVEALRREERPLSELATALGFYDQSHFTRLFRRQTGSTPARFRGSSPRGGPSEP